MKLYCGLILYIFIAVVPADCIEKVTNSPLIKQSNCGIDSLCTRLVHFGLCIPKLSQKMEEKCPNHCMTCKFGYGVVLKGDDSTSNIITNSDKFVDREMEKSFTDAANSYQHVFSGQFKSLIISKLVKDFVFPQFSQTEIGIISQDRIANISRSNIFLTNDSPSKSEIQREKLIRVNGNLKCYQEYFHGKREAENIKWKTAVMLQLKVDWILLSTSNIVKQYIEHDYYALAAVPLLIPEIKEYSGNGITKPVDLLTALTKIRKDIYDSQVTTIETMLRDFANMTNEVDIEYAANISGNIEQIRKATDVLLKSRSGFENDKGNLKRAVIEMAAEIEEASQRMKEINFSAVVKVFELITRMLKSFLDYVESNIDIANREIFLQQCKKEETDYTAVASDSIISVCTKFGKKSIIKDCLRDVFNSLRAMDIIAINCIGAQNLLPELACKKLFNITKQSAIMKNNILGVYYDETLLHKAIHQRVLEVSKGLDDVGDAVTKVLNALSLEFPEKKFFVHAVKGQMSYMGISILRDFERIISNRDIHFTVLWYSSTDQLIGNIWESCYEGELSSAQNWFINRPICTRVGVTVNKKAQFCKRDTCKIETGEKIPSCDREDGSGRFKCFSSSQQSERRDPIKYINTLTVHDEKVKKSKKNLTHSYQSGSAFSHYTISERLEEQLEVLSLGYCLHAVLRQKYVHGLHSSFSTTMNGAATLSSYFLDIDKSEYEDYWREQLKKMYAILNKLSDEESDFISSSLPYCNDLPDVDCEAAKIREKTYSETIKKLEKTAEAFGAKSYLFEDYRLKTIMPIPSVKFSEKTELRNKVDFDKLNKLNKDGKIFPHEYYYYPSTIFEIENYYYVGIFKKCSDKNIKFHTPTNNFEASCEDKLQKKTKIDKQYEEQMGRLVKKVKDSEESERKQKIYIIVGVSGALLLIIVGVMVAVIVLKKRKKSRLSQISRSSSVCLNKSKMSNSDINMTKQKAKHESKTSFSKTNQIAIKKTKSGQKFVANKKETKRSSTTPKNIKKL